MSDTAATAATASTADAPPAPEPAPAAAPNLAPGNLVSYTWEDTYADGAKRTRYGIVVDVPEPVEGEAPTVTVSWLEGAATMPSELLDAVSGV